MARFHSLGLIAALAATPALAGHVTLKMVDSNGDSFASYEEMVAAFPGMDMNGFKEMDANSDNRLSGTEINTLEAQKVIAQHQAGPPQQGSADALDTDGDGFISYEDVTRMYPDFTKLAFMDVDANDDNRLSAEEFYTPVMQKWIAACSHGEYLDLASMDANGDNFIDKTEMAAALPGLHDADFRTVDTNSDNRISANELMAPDVQCVLGGHGS